MQNSVDAERGGTGIKQMKPGRGANDTFILPVGMAGFSI